MNLFSWMTVVTIYICYPVKLESCTLSQNSEKQQGQLAVVDAAGGITGCESGDEGHDGRGESSK